MKVYMLRKLRDGRNYLSMRCKVDFDNTIKKYVLEDNAAKEAIIVARVIRDKFLLFNRFSAFVGVHIEESYGGASNFTFSKSMPELVESAFNDMHIKFDTKLTEDSVEEPFLALAESLFPGKDCSFKIVP